MAWIAGAGARGGGAVVGRWGLGAVVEADPTTTRGGDLVRGCVGGAVNARGRWWVFSGWVVSHGSGLAF